MIRRSCTRLKASLSASESVRTIPPTRTADFSSLTRSALSQAVRELVISISGPPHATDHMFLGLCQLLEPSDMVPDLSLLASVSRLCAKAGSSDVASMTLSHVVRQVYVLDNTSTLRGKVHDASPADAAAELCVSLCLNVLRGRHIPSRIFWHVLNVLSQLSFSQIGPYSQPLPQFLDALTSPLVMCRDSGRFFDALGSARRLPLLHSRHSRRATSAPFPFSPSAPSLPASLPFIVRGPSDASPRFEKHALSDAFPDRMAVEAALGIGGGEGGHKGIPHSLNKGGEESDSAVRSQSAGGGGGAAFNTSMCASRAVAVAVELMRSTDEAPRGAAQLASDASLCAIAAADYAMGVAVHVAHGEDFCDGDHGGVDGWDSSGIEQRRCDSSSALPFGLAASLVSMCSAVAPHDRPTVLVGCVASELAATAELLAGEDQVHATVDGALTRHSNVDWPLWIEGDGGAADASASGARSDGGGLFLDSGRWWRALGGGDLEMLVGACETAFEMVDNRTSAAMVVALEGLATRVEWGGDVVASRIARLRSLVGSSAAQ